MARRARQGRRPSVQQNITGTLIAIAREMQAKRDQNIMEAWKNGGEFEGTSVTDNEVKAYWKGRLTGLDENDPSYDTIRTQMLQLDYGIEQSKMDLKYVQGKISDTQYAQFFIKWSNKVPKNGEWWRTLQKDAARLMEAAKERSRINAEKAKQEAFNRFVEGKNKDIAVGTALTEAINRLSQETGLSVTGNGDRLLELLGEDYTENPGRYHALQDAIRDGGGDFPGTFTQSWVGAQVGQAEQAYDDVAVRARADGYATAYDAATKGQADMTAWASNMEVWPVAKAYDKAYAAFARVWDDPNASYRDKESAAARFSVAAGKLAETPGIDNATQQMLLADAQRAMGQDAGDAPSFGTVQLGHAGITPAVQQAVAVQRNAQALMDANPGAYVYASMNPDGTFDAAGKAPVGIVPAGGVPPDAVFVAVPGLDGKPSMVAVKPHSVYVNDPNNPGAAPIEVGRYISYMVGGKAIKMYGYQDSKGEARWSIRSPYADGVSGTEDKDGSLILTLPGVANPTTRAAQIDQQYGTNLAGQLATPGVSDASAVVYQRDENGKVTAKLTVKYDGKGFSVSQTGYTIDGEGKTVEGNTTTVPIGINAPADLANAALAPSRLANADVPGSFTSALAASVTAATSTMSSGQVAALAQDPAFQHAFVTQTMQTTGATSPLDPRVIKAWDDVTKKANQGWQLQEQMLLRGGQSSTSRTDLDYPGQRPADPTKTTASVTFAGKDLKLPGLPAYFNSPQGAAPNIDLNGVSDFLGGAVQFGQSLLQQGQQVGLPAQPGTSSTVTPTPVTIASPTSMTPPVASVAPMPSSTPTPTQISTIIGGGGSSGVGGSTGSSGSSGNAGNMA